MNNPLEIVWFFPDPDTSNRYASENMVVFVAFKGICHDIFIIFYNIDYNSYVYIYIYSHHTDFPLLNTIEAMH